MPLAVLGEVGEAEARGRGGVAYAHRLAVDADAAVRRPQAHQPLHQLGPSGADQAAEAQDLAAAQLEAGAADEPGHREGLDGERHRGLGRGRLGREQLGQRAPDHLPGHLVLAERRGGCGDHVAAVAQHGDAVGDGAHLVELVRGVEDGDALGAQPLDLPEQHPALLRGEHGGRLVEDEHAGLADQRLGDFDHLPVSHREVAHGGCRVDRGLEFEQQRPRPRPHRPGGEERAAADLAAQEDVGLHAELFGQVELLVDQHDPAGFRRLAGGERDRRACKRQAARGGSLVAGQDLHQGGLAGAVLADQGVHLAGAQVDREVEQHLDCAEALA